MEKDIVIKVQNLSKIYKLYDKPVDRLKETVHPLRKKYHREFYALKDVSFELKKGETVGIIGKNGSGKSTLLKIITGVLTPTSGSVDVKGKVSALLELGAGFNPEFTGIENVYLAGAIMGYTREKMDTKLEEILSFADIGEFVHQPVKTYSSGMFVRLAFAVGISVEPDVLIVDEVLSVGDIAFTNKCIARIKVLRDQGTSILFVSHDLSTLQLICDRAIWINNGEVVSSGAPVSVCQDYNIYMTGTESDNLMTHHLDFISQQDTGMAKFVKVNLDAWTLGNKSIYNVGRDISVNFSLRALQALGKVIFAISIYRSDGEWVVGQVSRYANEVWPGVLEGETLQGLVVLAPNCLCPGEYRLAMGAYSEDLSLCYALTDVNIGFEVRSDFPTWGKFLHPCKWIKRTGGD